jgi:hypothetical protein
MVKRGETVKEARDTWTLRKMERQRETCTVNMGWPVPNIKLPVGHT